MPTDEPILNGSRMFQNGAAEELEPNSAVGMAIETQGRATRASLQQPMRRHAFELYP
ncbi:hypothetical protein Dimus_010550 [Dionaea muscipula]